MEEGSAVPALVEFGLTPNEARLYKMLATMEVAEATTLAENLGINRPAIYPLLKSLSEKGLVDVMPEGVNRYSALPLDDFLDSVTDNARSRLDILRKKRDNIDKEFASIDQRYSPGNLKFISHRAAIHKQSQRMIREARQDIFVLTTRMGLIRTENYFLNLYREKNGEGVKIRHLVQVDGEDRELIEKLGEVMEIRGTDVEPLMTFMIVDNRQAVLFRPNPDNAGIEHTRDFGLWSNDSSLILTFTSIFNELWENSKEI